MAQGNDVLDEVVLLHTCEVSNIPERRDGKVGDSETRVEFGGNVGQNISPASQDSFSLVPVMISGEVEQGIERELLENRPFGRVEERVGSGARSLRVGESQVGSQVLIDRGGLDTVEHRLAVGVRAEECELGVLDVDLVQVALAIVDFAMILAAIAGPGSTFTFLARDFGALILG